MGQFRCQHVAATLFYGYKRASKTDLKCSWIKHPKSAPPKTKTMAELYPPKQQEYRLSVSLRKRLLSAYNLEKRASIQWGLTHEKTAINEYCNFGEVSVLETGASPDGFVQGDPKHIKVHFQGEKTGSPNIIEVKCPFSAKTMSIKDACANLKDFFLECDSEGTLHLKENHDYWHQVQGQLYLTGTNCCDFVVWTPLNIEVIRITRKESWLTNLGKHDSVLFQRLFTICAITVGLYHSPEPLNNFEKTIKSNFIDEFSSKQLTK